MHFCLGPFEGCRVLIPAGNKSFDCLDEQADTGEVCALQGAAAQDAKPAFDLIEPGAMGGNKVKMYVGMSFEPAVLRGPSLRAAILSVAKRLSHLLTRAARVFIFAAICLPFSPLAASKITLALWTIRCSLLELRIQRKSVSSLHY